SCIWPCPPSCSGKAKQCSPGLTCRRSASASPNTRRPHTPPTSFSADRSPPAARRRGADVGPLLRQLCQLSAGAAGVHGDRREPDDGKGGAAWKSMLETSYALLDRRMAGRTWAVGENFSLADCAARLRAGGQKNIRLTARLSHITA